MKEVRFHPLGAINYMNRCVTFPGNNGILYRKEGSTQIALVLGIRYQGVKWLQRDVGKCQARYRLPFLEENLWADALEMLVK